MLKIQGRCQAQHELVQYGHRCVFVVIYNGFKHGSTNHNQGLELPNHN